MDAERRLFVFLTRPPKARPRRLSSRGDEGSSWPSSRTGPVCRRASIPLRKRQGKASTLYVHSGVQNSCEGTKEKSVYNEAQLEHIKFSKKLLREENVITTLCNKIRSHHCNS